MCVLGLNCVWLFATPWTVACQFPLSMGFPRQEYRGRLPFPTPGHLPNPAQGLKLGLLLCRQILYHLSHQGSPNNTLVFQSCLTLCDPVDCSPPGSSVHGIFRGSSQPRDWSWVFCVAGRFFTVWVIRDVYWDTCSSLTLDLDWLRV